MDISNTTTNLTLGVVAQRWWATRDATVSEINEAVAVVANHRAECHRTAHARVVVALLRNVRDDDGRDGARERCLAVQDATVVAWESSGVLVVAALVGSLFPARARSGPQGPVVDRAAAARVLGALLGHVFCDAVQRPVQVRGVRDTQAAADMAHAALRPLEQQEHPRDVAVLLLRPRQRNDAPEPPRQNLGPHFDRPRRWGRRVSRTSYHARHGGGSSRLRRERDPGSTADSTTSRHLW